MSDSVRLQRATSDLEDAIVEVTHVIRRSQQVAAELVSPGMQPATYKALVTIAKRGPLSLSALAELLSTDKGQLSRTVTELETLGLVTRSTCPDDARVKMVAVSDEGSSRLAVLHTHRNALRQELSTWQPESLEQLAALVRHLGAALRTGLASIQTAPPRTTTAPSDQPKTDQSGSSPEPD